MILGTDLTRGTAPVGAGVARGALASVGVGVAAGASVGAAVGTTLTSVDIGAGDHLITAAVSAALTLTTVGVGAVAGAATATVIIPEPLLSTTATWRRALLRAIGWVPVPRVPLPAQQFLAMPMAASLPVR